MGLTTFVNQAIDFDEWDQSPSRDHGNGHPVITIIGSTAWSDVDNFIGFVMPVGQNIGGQFGVALAANTKFRVVNYTVEGFGGLLPTGNNGLNTYPIAKWTIKCQVPMGQSLELTQPFQNPDPVPWLIHEWDAGVQIFTLPRQSLQWGTDSKSVMSQITGSMKIPTIEHTITWPKLLNPPFAAIRACVGCINASAITFSTGVIAIGQGLFVGPKLHGELMSNGTIARTLVYKISERPLIVPGSGNSQVPLDWNYFPRDDGGAGFAGTGWDALVNKQTGKRTYQTAEFLNLFPSTF